MRILVACTPIVLCCAMPSARVVSLAASSGPRPHIEVTVLEEGDGPSARRTLEVFDVGAGGLSPRARLDALALVGVARDAERGGGARGPESVAAFRAYEAGDPSRVHS